MKRATDDVGRYVVKFSPDKFGQSCVDDDDPCRVHKGPAVALGHAFLLRSVGGRDSIWIPLSLQIAAVGDALFSALVAPSLCALSPRGMAYQVVLNEVRQGIDR